MTSATTTKSVSAALAKREQKAAKARAEARDKRQAKEAYEAEVHDLRARYASLDPNSAEARDIGEEIKAREQSRIHNTGPLADAYEAAKAPYMAAGTALETYKQEHCLDRLAEVTAGHDELQEDLRQAARQGLAVVRALLDEKERVKAVILDTPGLRRRPQVEGHDGRLYDWLALFEDMVDAEVLKPGLSPVGEVHLERFSV